MDFRDLFRWRKDLKLYEYQTNSLFEKFNIPVPAGKVAIAPEQATEIARELNTPVVIKPQLLKKPSTQNINSQIATTPQIAGEYTYDVLNKDIDGQIIHSVLIEIALDIITKIYITIVNNYELNKPIIIVSEKSIDSKFYDENQLNSLVYEIIDPFIGFLDYQARELASSLNLPFEHWKSFTQITQNLFRCYVATDASKAEISPLVITNNNEFFALGGAIVVDDKAIYRQPDLANMSIESHQTHDAEINTSKIKGQIVCAVNGSGIALTMLDMFAISGKKNLESMSIINMGEDAQTQKVATILHSILDNVETKAAFINIFAGITSCDILALNMLQIIEARQSPIPVIIRLTGERAREGQNIINASHLPNVCTTLTLTEAVQKAITAINGS
jgi:succinyl-CoA synthetase beta subunit